jgi:hypothetical protein
VLRLRKMINNKTRIPIIDPMDPKETSMFMELDFDLELELESELGLLHESEQV